MKQETFETFWNNDSQNFKDLIEVIRSIKIQIEPDARDHDDVEDRDDSIQITISVNDDCTAWSYQSGDNSYTGSCYSHPYWGVSYIFEDSEPNDVAHALLTDLADQIDFQ